MTIKTENTYDRLTVFDDYLRFGTDEEAPKGPTTRKVYLWTVRQFIEFLDGRKPTTELAREYIRGLEERGNSPTSINRHIWALKSYFRFVKKKLKIRGLKTIEHLPRVPRDGEWARLLDICNDTIYNPDIPTYTRNRGKLELALLYAYGGAGLRLSEALRLTLDDIADEGFLRVIRKGGRQDFVPVEDEVIRGIKDYIDSRPQNGQFVFPGKYEGKPMAPRTAQTIIKNLCRRAGLDEVHVHSLRHMVGYQYRKLGASERDIQDVLGHASINTTKIYTHLTQEDLRRKLPKRFKQARQGRLDWK